MDELMEGCIWIYNSKHQGLIGTSCLYQQGFLVTDEKKDLGLKPEWLRHMTYHLHLRKKFLTLRLARDDVAHDENLTELRRLIGIQSAGAEPVYCQRTAAGSDRV